MSDDLVKQLREYGSCGMVFEAADRIEKLEVALKMIAGCTSKMSGHTVTQRLKDTYDIARKALEGKDD